MENLLSQLGVSILSNRIYDFLQKYFSKNPHPTKDDLKNELISFLNIQNADIKAEKIINFLANNGDINIEGSKIFANKSIIMKSSRGTKLIFGNNSTSETENTKINVGHNAFIEAQGGAGTKQNEDGSISFLT